MSLVLQTRLTKFATECRRNAGLPTEWPQDPPPVQSDQSDEDPREKSESRAGIPSFERDAERRAVDVIL
jgi:hypothetical protein